MRFGKIPLIVLSGLIWTGIGVMLLIKGLNFVVYAEANCTILKTLIPYLGSREQAVVFLIAIGIFAGFLKGRFVLIKATRKIVARIAKLDPPVKISQIYDKRYYILMAIMMGIGFLLNFLNVPTDIRGTIDIAIGSALMNGAMGFFRCALTFKTN